MNTKTLMAAVAGGLALFAMGFIIYVLLLPDFFALDVAKDPPGFLFIIIGELVFGFALAWVLGLAGAKTLADGAKTGAMLGFLVALGIGLIWYGATTVADIVYYLSEAVAWAVRFAVAGAVVGWLLGRGA